MMHLIIYIYGYMYYCEMRSRTDSVITFTDILFFSYAYKLCFITETWKQIYQLYYIHYLFFLIIKTA